MNTKMKWFTAACSAIVALSVCTACQDDDIDNTAGTTNDMFTYNVTVETSASDGIATGTRSLNENNRNLLHSTWEQDDQIIAYNLSDNQPEVYLGNALLDIYHIKIICEYLWKDTTQQLLGLHDAKITNTYEIMCMKGRGCNWVLRLTRNTSFFDTFNVEHWEHSNNLLTHIRRTDRLSPYIFVHVCAREALRHIHLERVCHTVPLPFSHARFPTSIS